MDLRTVRTEKLMMRPTFLLRDERENEGMKESYAHTHTRLKITHTQ